MSQTAGRPGPPWSTPLMHEGVDDAANGLVRRAQAGDRAAREELGGRASRVAFLLALQLLGRRDAARDAAQDALVRFFGALDRLDPERPFEPWLRRIVRNCVVDMTRRGKIRRHRSLDDEGDEAPLQIADPSADPGLDAQRRERQKALFAALQRLNEDHREILVLRDYQDLSYGEIADVLGVAQGTVMSRLHRARKALRSEVLEGGEIA